MEKEWLADPIMPAQPAADAAEAQLADLKLADQPAAPEEEVGLMILCSLQLLRWASARAADAWAGSVGSSSS